MDEIRADGWTATIKSAGPGRTGSRVTLQASIHYMFHASALGSRAREQARAAIIAAKATILVPAFALTLVADSVTAAAEQDACVIASSIGGVCAGEENLPMRAVTETQGKKNELPARLKSSRGADRTRAAPVPYQATGQSLGRDHNSRVER